MGDTAGVGAGGRAFFPFALKIQLADEIFNSFKGKGCLCARGCGGEPQDATCHALVP